MCKNSFGKAHKLYDKILVKFLTVCNCSDKDEELELCQKYAVAPPNALWKETEPKN